MVVIPQDIIDNIIEAVDDDGFFFRKCALVSSSFLLPCRKRLFSNIVLSLNGMRPGRELHQFLVENPVIQSFVRSIRVGRYEVPKSRNRTSITAILRLPFCCLEHLSIDTVHYRLDWNNFSSELKDALSTIIHSSTLKTLHLGVKGVPTTLFHGVHFTKLEVSSISPIDFYGEQSGLLTPAASEGVATTTVVDRCVWHLHLYEPVHYPTEPIFLPFMGHLRVFEVIVSVPAAEMSDLYILSLLMRSLRASLTSPTTLEHLKFNIIFEESNIDLDYPFFYDLRYADVWRHLDSIITHPTGSRLQRVDININYYGLAMVEPDHAGVVKAVLDALPLLHERGILFVEACG